MTAKPESNFFAAWNLKDCRSTPSTKSPAPHQKAALTRLNAWYEKLPAQGDGGILVLPTGGGKTFTAAHFLCTGPLSDGYKVLWLAHTHHLLEQAFHAFTAGLLGQIREPRLELRLKVVSGTPGHFPPRDLKATDDVVIATLQTITNAHREQLSQLQKFLDSAKGKLFVVFDEAHHSPAPSYRKLLLALRDRGAHALGLTATPTYSDETKQGWLKKLFPQGILAQSRAGELIAQGVLAKPHFEPVPTSIVPAFDESDYQKWLGTYRDIPDGVISHLAKNAERNGFIADTYAQRQQRYGKTIIFTDRWYQCESIVQALEKRGIKAGAVYSHEDAQVASVEGRKKRSRDENAKVMNRFRQGELQVLVNVRMLTEGTDIPDAQTVFLTRQTTSQILLTQMVGRALRGPKFGGTEDAYIVPFVDDWQQTIRWAEYDPLTDSGTDDKASPKYKHPPLQLISIDLIKKLARQMDSGTNVAPGPFTSLMPVGWYRVVFDVCLPGSEEVESRDQLVMVFEDERKGFDTFIAALSKKAPEALGEETVLLESQRSTLEAWRTKYLGKAGRAPSDLLLDVFHLARHLAQGNGTPEFFPFEVRNSHDLDAVARGFIARDLGPKSIQEGLRAEYERKDRFWRTLFPRFEQFRSYHDSCQARLLTGSDSGVREPAPQITETPSNGEPDEAVKEQVKRRDGHKCLACGSTRLLQVDHILADYRGGPNHIDNLQTLCKSCNKKKGTRTMRFTMQETSRATRPTTLEDFDVPREEDAGNRDQWERFLRRTLNFVFECGAVSKVIIGSRGDTYYNWSVELFPGNPPSWVEPLLQGLVDRIESVREGANKPPLKSLRVTSPGVATAEWP